MHTSGPDDLQGAAPASLVAVLRNSLKDAGYDPGETTLIFKRITNGNASTKGIRFEMCGDSEVTLTLQGDDAGKLFHCNLRSDVEDDRGNMDTVLRKLKPIVDKAMKSPVAKAPPAPSANEPSSVYLKVFDLKGEDLRWFPRSQQKVLEDILAGLDLSDEVVLRFEKFVPGTAETMGVKTLGTKPRAVDVSLQETAQGRCAICCLSIRNGQDGQWLKGKLEQKLNPSSPVATAPLNDAEDEDEDEQEEPPVQDELADESEHSENLVPPVAAAEGKKPLARIKAMGFSNNPKSVAAFLERLRSDYPGGTVGIGGVHIAIRDYTDTHAAGRLFTGLVNHGYLVDADAGNYRIIGVDEAPVPPEHDHKGRKNGRKVLLPATDSMVIRLNQVELVATALIQKKAGIATKEARLEVLKANQAELQAKVRRLEAEIAEDKDSLPSEEELEQFDNVLKRFQNKMPELRPSPLNKASE